MSRGMLLSLQGASPHNVNHAQKTTMRLLLYLLVDQLQGYTADSAFHAHFWATYILLKLDAHKSIRGAQAVRLACMLLKSLLWYTHLQSTC